MMYNISMIPTIFRKVDNMEKYLDETLSVQERAEALTDAMTVEEQASQLRYDAPEIKRQSIPFSVSVDLSDLCYGVSYPVSEPVLAEGTVRNTAGVLMMKGNVSTTIHGRRDNLRGDPCKICPVRKARRQRYLQGSYHLGAQHQHFP